MTHKEKRRLATKMMTKQERKHRGVSAFVCAAWFRRTALIGLKMSKRIAKEKWLSGIKKLKEGEAYWRVGQRVQYLGMNCKIIKTTPFNKQNNSHYVTLLPEGEGNHKEIYSAFDKNLLPL